MISQQSQTAEKLQSYFCSRVGGSVSPDQSLFDSGLLDSLSLTELLGFLENEFSIQIFPGDVRIENLDTIQRITAFLQKKGERAHA